MKAKYLAIFLTTVLVISSCAYFTYKYFTKEKIMPEVAEETQPTPVYKIIGYSVEGRKIESFTYGNGEHHIVVVGGIHGGYEWNSVYLAYKIMDYLEEDLNYIRKNIKVTVIPSLNPDGVFKAVGKEGRFGLADVTGDSQILASARFNANKVDLNRNFDCKWQPESKWQSKTVSAGTDAFSEPEAEALRNFIMQNKPSAVIFFHSQANTVYASKCEGDIMQETNQILDIYSKASLYKAENSFDNYEITGDAGDWLSSIGIPAISVELKTHETIEWEKNLSGITGLLNYFDSKTSTLSK